MIQIQDIINKLPFNDVQLSLPNVLISEPISLNVKNERHDVLMWVASKNINALAEVKYGTIICPKIDNNLLHPNCNEEINY